MKQQPKQAWRQATLATKLAHRHEHSGWGIAPAPQRAPQQARRKRLTWGDVAFYAIYALSAFVGLLWLVREAV